jgi:hypothetical protein
MSAAPDTSPWPLPPGQAYIVGAEYSGSDTTATVVQATLFTPNDTSSLSDDYYVILSIWDNAESYDQLGLAATETQAWEVVWAGYTDCGTNQGGSNGGVSGTLAVNTEYTFEMSISSGTVSYDVWQGSSASGTLVWDHAFDTGGSDFVEQPYSCDDNTYNDYTDFEEIYSAAGPTPTWSFSFDHNIANGAAVTAWAQLGPIREPSGAWYYVSIQGSNVLIMNEWFTLSSTCGAGSGLCTGSIYWTTTATLYPVFADLEYECGECEYDVDFQATTLPTGWTATFNPQFTTGDTQPVTSLDDVGAYCGTYGFVIQAYEATTGLWTAINLHVSVVGCNSGGCVAWGTPILTPTGYVAVQNLRQGQQVEEFNLSTGALAPGVYLSGNPTNVTQLIDINQGRLFLTPTDQPIFIQNATFTGWLRDPQNLTTADRIYDPVSQIWIPVTGVLRIHQSSIVFDVVTSGFNNFIANGTLLDKKA